MLHPTWLGPANAMTNWKVVKHQNKLVVVYIGRNVRTQYGSRVNGQWVNDLTEERPKLPIMTKSKDQSGSSAEGYGPEEAVGHICIAEVPLSPCC